MYIYRRKPLHRGFFFWRGIYVANIMLILKSQLSRVGFVNFLCETYFRAPAHPKKKTNKGSYKYTYKRLETNNARRNTNTHTREHLFPTRVHPHKLGVSDRNAWRLRILFIVKLQTDRVRLLPKMFAFLTEKTKTDFHIFWLLQTY